jgi:hypothetical protein
MRINELLSEEQLDEISLGKRIATGAARFAQGAGDVIGGTLGGIQGAWNRGERAYQRGKQVVDPEGNPRAASAGGTTTTTDTTTTGGTNAGAAPATVAAPTAAAAPAAAPAAPAAAGTNPAPAAPAGTNPEVGTSYDTQAGKPQSAPGNRQKGDIVRSGQNTFQYTGEPGKEWFVAGGPLQEPNPQADRYNNIQAVGGKKFISADNAKRNLQVSERKKLKKKMVAEFHSNFLGMII